jgi:hypothetical protein
MTDTANITDTDAGTDTNDVDLAPEIQGATEAVVTFHPQIWKDDYAVTGNDEALRRSYDEWAELWEHEVRNALADEIDVNEFGHGPIENVPVQYDTDGE